MPKTKVRPTDEAPAQAGADVVSVDTETKENLPAYVIVDETKVIDVHGNTLKFRRDQKVTDPQAIRLVLTHGIKIRYDVCPNCGHRVG